MSATGDSPLGGFEQRLLTQLKAEVASRPIVDPPAPSRASPRRRRIPALATAAIAGLTVAVLSVLPAAAPSLAQAFPILSERTHPLPARLAQALRAQWRTPAAPHFDLSRAFAFSTPAGTGYVVVDQRSRWLCILVPGYSANSGTGRCEQLRLARLGAPALSVRIVSRARQEVVSLLPRGATVTRATFVAGATSVTLHRGILAIAAQEPVTLTTTIDGDATTTTYRP